ncbi:hypothetical protein HID58_092633 [Brassica napus]|uniref:Uncharacterized protein n=1 Tax=Brassica napus TaxID=3708 RepID=A0ABQ7XDP8_BRANA|nr:hypothetical protein HID58_092633 [Brassica napus]
MSEKAQLTPNSGYNETSTSTTSVSHTVYAPLDFINAGEASSSNRFANLAMLEEEIETEIVSSPTHSLAQTVNTNSPFVFNSSLPSSPASVSDPLILNSQVPDEFGFTLAVNSRCSSDMAHRSRGGRCLKPSQKLKDMEWFTFGKKGRRGRGGTAHHRSSS